MSSFTEPLQLFASDGKWVTSRPLTYEIGYKGSGIRFTVPADYTTDLASIPRMLWSVLPPHDPKVAAPAVLHDFLVKQPEFNRNTADAIFYEALKALRVPVWRRVVMYCGVVLFNIVKKNS